MGPLQRAFLSWGELPGECFLWNSEVRGLVYADESHVALDY